MLGLVDWLVSFPNSSHDKVHVIHKLLFQLLHIMEDQLSSTWNSVEEVTSCARSSLVICLFDSWNVSLSRNVGFGWFPFQILLKLQTEQFQLLCNLLKNNRLFCLTISWLILVWKVSIKNRSGLSWVKSQRCHLGDQSIFPYYINASSAASTSSV